MRIALDGATLGGLVNSAGVAWSAPLLHQPVADFQKMINTNLVGTFMVTQVLLLLFEFSIFVPDVGVTVFQGCPRSSFERFGTILDVASIKKGLVK